MSMDHDEVRRQGGPAFPVSISGFGDNGWQGMTLRDWFAGQALAGLLADPDVLVVPDEGPTVDELAYAIADRMLAYRNGEPKPRTAVPQSGADG